MKKFKGRVIADGDFTGEAVVSRGGFNTLATFQSSAMKNEDHAIAGDQNNKDIYGIDITGKIMCLPKTIGSTTGGMVLQAVCSLGMNPQAFLFSEHIDSLAASGVILSRVWEESDMICIDKLGQEFLDSVKTGDKVEIKKDGTVIIHN